MTNSHEINTEELRIRKRIQKGNNICIMILGSKGSGKSTFLNNLCSTNIFPTSQVKECYQDPAYAHISPKLLEIKEKVCIEEGNGSKINLDILLFQGAGDNLDNTKSPGIIRNYLMDQFDTILNEEKQVSRKPKVIDSRPHVCIYFLKPNSRGLREYDIKMMKAIEDFVNIIPVITKIDTLTREELIYNKRLVMETINHYQIQIFDFKDDLLMDNILATNANKLTSLTKDINNNLRISEMLPFGIICSNESITEENGAPRYIRNFDWGSVAIDDVHYSDFLYLKSIIFGSHFQDFKDITENVLYENYRTKKLSNRDEVNKLSVYDDYGNGGKSSMIYKRENELKQSVMDPIDAELEEKNKLIEAYKRKINELQMVITSKSYQMASDPN
ncbi:hypothetical protein TPHA_0C02140 [Tetrapisispora phaffii CBS 4417]|uniref:Septin-type G domain-containing protein n=1 Tax=Tetrapisispora phaffii (strain ATCC 24235 / CBS 4417 / NBRC 1672 / NRRL Y-8282 / UCD 70-5) TaxID=1071381 RepID=G8BRJ2_TETPH|nr:hypothetical protein TPHA_0C02140 [Tetrapisispora phaffii CBS 4417]CCE62368.1 hypothetical protein TPHA_0C02140 [Tetrapisispora phaffii CBS 4417]